MVTKLIGAQNTWRERVMTITDQFLVHYLKTFEACPFQLILHDKKYSIGIGDPQFVVEFVKEPNKKELATSTSLALGEAYMRGDLVIHGDLLHCLDRFLSQISKFTTNKSSLKKLLFPSRTKHLQKEEISHHYDIGNDFYKLWLDDTMSYSCAYFKEDTKSLHDAQVDKVHYILDKLYLKEGMSLLDIGCGWGFLLIEAAKKYKITGVGITLSKEQQAKFKERIKEEGLEDYLRVELLDYRDISSLNQQFDRVVSVGMLEHVGRENYDCFLKSVQSVLKPQGLFLLHYISSKKEHAGDPWLKKYIFPGGVIPSLREIISLSADHQFSVLDVDNLRRHYYQTLLCWNQSFQNNRSSISKQFGEEFAKMWELYLCSCAAAFHNGVVELHQLLFSNGIHNELPMTRWY